jgi:hypothetical protein
MTQTQNPDLVKDLFSFPGIENLSAGIIEDNLFRISKKGNDTPVVMELPVNNYLKTPEEIEMEFLRLTHSRKVAFHERQDSLDNTDTSTSQSNAYMNIHNLEVTLSGFMEENY